MDRATPLKSLWVLTPTNPIPMGTVTRMALRFFSVVIQMIPVPRQLSTGFSRYHRFINLENQPIGTQTGEFNATDPDADSCRFSLVDETDFMNLFQSQCKWFAQLSIRFRLRKQRIELFHPGSGHRRTQRIPGKSPS